MNCTTETDFAKPCSKCGCMTSREGFYADKRNADGLYSWCKACLKKHRGKTRSQKRAYDQEYYTKNRDAKLRSFREYQIKNNERLRQYWKEYRTSNAGRCKRNFKRWYENHPERFRAYGARRRLKMSCLEESLTRQQWEECQSHFSFRCAYCGKKKTITLDHFVPLKNDGELSVNNVIPACKSCNSSKGATPFAEWYPRQTFFSESRMKKIYRYLRYDGGAQQLSIL